VGPQLTGVAHARATLRVRIEAPEAVRVWVQAAGRLTARWNERMVGPERSGSL
jgi:hypothetical protein